jgi:hypothetical protein
MGANTNPTVSKSNRRNTNRAQHRGCGITLVWFPFGQGGTQLAYLFRMNCRTAGSEWETEAQSAVDMCCYHLKCMDTGTLFGCFIKRPATIISVWRYKGRLNGRRRRGFRIEVEKQLIPGHVLLSPEVHGYFQLQSVWLQTLGQYASDGRIFFIYSYVWCIFSSSNLWSRKMFSFLSNLSAAKEFVEVETLRGDRWKIVDTSACASVIQGSKLSATYWVSKIREETLHIS